MEYLEGLKGKKGSKIKSRMNSDSLEGNYINFWYLNLY